MLSRGVVMTVIAGVAGAACVALPVDNSKQASAAVQGRLLKPDGVTGISTQVTAQLLGNPVNGVSPFFDQATVVADNNGNFLFKFTLSNVDAQNGTVNISVLAPIASGLAPKDTVGIPVRIGSGLNPTDTTFVQIKLQAR